MPEKTYIKRGGIFNQAFLAVVFGLILGLVVTFGVYFIKTGRRQATVEPSPSITKATSNISEREQKIYDYFKSHLRDYSDSVWIKYNEKPPMKELDLAEERAINDTATYFSITSDEVKNIFSKVKVEEMKAGDL